VVVLSPTLDWRDDTGWPTVYGLRDVAGYLQDRRPGRHLIMVPGDYRAEAETVARWCMEAQKPFLEGRSTSRLLLVLEEASEALPSSRPPGRWLKALIARGRHYGVDMIAISQRPSQVHPDMRSNSGLRVYYKVNDHVDWKPIADHLGPAGESRVRTLPEFHGLACWGSEQRVIKAPLR